jgi:hypothetical protein
VFLHIQWNMTIGSKTVDVEVQACPKVVSQNAAVKGGNETVVDTVAHARPI